METPSFKETFISQVSALKLLIKLGKQEATESQNVVRDDIEKQFITYGNGKKLLQTVLRGEVRMKI